MMRKRLCKRCEDTYWKSKGHECPRMWIHRVSERSVTVKVEAQRILELRWEGERLILYPSHRLSDLILDKKKKVEDVA